MVFFCGFDILNTICYASFEQGDSFIPQISLRFLGWEVWDVIIDFSTKKIAASSEALSLMNIFHRQRRRRSRSGVSPDFFSSPQQSSTAFNSSTTKNPLLFPELPARVTDLLLKGVALPVPSCRARDGSGWEPARVSLLRRYLASRTFVFTACKFAINLTSASPQNMSRMTVLSFFPSPF